MYADLGQGQMLDLDPPSPNGVDLLYSHEYVARRMRRWRSRRDALPTTNLYVYVHGRPTVFVDPFGLQAIDCSYYEVRCECTSYWNLCQKLYYCFAAQIVCNYAGSGPWRDCVRSCLTTYDENRRELIEDGNVPGIGIFIGCLEHLPLEVIDHVWCFSVCAWDVNSY